MVVEVQEEEEEVVVAVVVAARARRTRVVAACGGAGGGGGAGVGVGGGNQRGGGMGGGGFPTEPEEPLVLNGRIPRMERVLFTRIKTALGSRERWIEFLKCLDLFSQEVLTRAELVAIAVDIFGQNRELLEEFDYLLASRGATEDATEDAWFSVPLSEIDFDQSRRCTPSYRALPVTFPRPACSERTELCRSVLNDTWVSAPTGSEDFSFKSMRKNTYEEALFKCEDDRYELDMAIDSNTATIHVLEPLLEKIKDAQAAAAAAAASAATSDETTGAPPPRVHFRIDRKTLTVIHLKSIARVYGEHAEEIFELLRRAPEAAIPIVLARMKQKDIELRKKRLELNKEWRDVMERNYTKSLDHRSFYFKQNDRKLLMPRSLVTELKEAEGKRLTLELRDAIAHRTTALLLRVGAERSLAGPGEVEKFVSALNVVARLMGAPPTSAAEPSPAAAPKANASVFTRFGPGVVSKPASGVGGLHTVVLSGGATVNVREILVVASTSGGGAKAATDSSSKPSGGGGGGEFFVGNSGYLFLRLYHLLYERVSKAERLCESMMREPQKATIRHVLERTASPVPPSGVGAGEAAASSSSSSSSTAAGDAATTAATATTTTAATTSTPDASSRFPALMELLKTYVRGGMEATRFEDDVYSLMGTGAFFVFGIDKLVTATVRALVTLTTETHSARLNEALAAYQSARTFATAVDMYRAQADALSLAQIGAGVRVVVTPGEVDASALASSATAADGMYSDEAWKTAPSMQLVLCEALPMATTAVPPGVRSTSPVPGSSSSTEEMGELDAVEPIKYTFDVAGADESAAAGTGAGAGAGADADDGAPARGAKSRRVQGEDQLTVYVARKLPGSEDVFRRMQAWFARARDEGEAASLDWWRAAARDADFASNSADEDLSGEEGGGGGGGGRR